MSRVVYQLSREQIVACARKAIADARNPGNGDDPVEIPTPLVRRLMKVARTAPKLALGAWVNSECGCLIGEHREFSDRNVPLALALHRIPPNERRVGENFDRHMRAALGEGMAPGLEAGIVEVTG